MSHHLGLGLLVFDHFLVQMSFIIASEGIRAQGAMGHLDCHGEYAQPCERIGSQVMDLQVEALQNFAYKVLTWKP